jgi:hypothetical protein
MSTNSGVLDFREAAFQDGLRWAETAKADRIENLLNARIDAEDYYEHSRSPELIEEVISAIYPERTLDGSSAIDRWHGMVRDDYPQQRDSVSYVEHFLEGIVPGAVVRQSDEVRSAGSQWMRERLAGAPRDRLLRFTELFPDDWQWWLTDRPAEWTVENLFRVIDPERVRDRDSLQVYWRQQVGDRLWELTQRDDSGWCEAELVLAFAEGALDALHSPSERTTKRRPPRTLRLRPRPGENSTDNQPGDDRTTHGD